MNTTLTVAPKSFVDTENNSLMSRNTSLFDTDVMSMLNELMVQVERLEQSNIETLHAYRTAQQSSAIRVQRQSYETKRDSLAQQRNTDLVRGAVEIGSGSLSIIGSVRGGINGGMPTKTTDEIRLASEKANRDMNAITGLGRSMEGTSKPITAFMNENAQKTQLVGEIEGAAARQQEESFAQTAQQVNELRQKLRDTQRSLLDAHGSLAAALRS